MTKLHSATSALASLVLFQNALVATSNCAPIEKLGATNLERFDYSVDMDVSDDCDYTVTIQMKHDPNLPIPDDPRTQCDPSSLPPDIAPDGIPYFAFRWRYESVPDHIRLATGIDHISLDFAPCGHPPLGVFTIPHYDFHIYLESPEFRQCMTCDKMPDTPACDPESQSTPSGNGFLNVGKVISGHNAESLANNAESLANMPVDYVFGVSDMIPLMGGHAWNPDDVDTPWIIPLWVMGPYNGGLVDYEPMIPLSFMTGDTDNNFSDTLTYLGQTIGTLPTEWSAAYDAASNYLTVTLKGPSAVCSASGMSSKSSKSRRR